MAQKVNPIHPDAAPKVPPAAPIGVRFLLFDGFQPIDLAGPWQAFATANEAAGSPCYELGTVGPSATAVSADGGLSIAVSALLDTATGGDTVIVPGGPGVHEISRHASVLEWLRQADRTTRRTCSVCTGAFVLAATGLLDGRRVTTHWRSAARLQEAYPGLEVNDELIYCESGKYWTTAGVTAGIDLALALIERDFGADLSLRVARRLVVYLRRDGDQRQYSQALRLQDKMAAPFRELLGRMEGSLHQDWSVDRMAECCGMSRRSFQRKFTASTGVSPMAALASLRREQAGLLERGAALTRKAVARSVGL
jgi:transcriptional regulator GlxA family with amidase domain